MGTIVSNSEYFRTDADIDVSSNVAVNKDIRVTNFHATNSITVTLTDTQTYNVVAGETVDLFYDGTSYIRLNESGVSDALTAHINSTGSSSTTVHGINQGLSTSDTPTFPQLELNHATNDTELFFQEGDNNRYRLRYDVSANILDVSRYNDDGSFRQTALTLHRNSNGDMTLNGAFNCYSINTGHGDYEIGQNLRTTDNVNFYDIGCSSSGSGSSFLKFMNESDRAFDIVYDPTPDYLYFQTREDDGTFRDGFMSVPRSANSAISINRPVQISGLLEVADDIEIRSNGTDTFGLLKYQDDGIDRFFLSHNISNDSLQVVSRNDDGTFRDTAISIPRTNDAEITIDRPVQINGDLDLQSNNITSGQFQGADKVTAITTSPTDAELPTAQAVQEYVTAATGQTITGDAIPAGSKLISDGTPAVYTSDFDYPILPNTSFVPSTIEVDNLYYDNTNNVKFVGQRWMKGIFDEYTNVIDNNVLPTPGSNCTVSFDEDGWIRVEATATSSDSNTTAATYSFSAFSTVGAFSCLIKRGGSTPMTQIGSAGTNSGVNIEVNWSTKSIVYQSSTVDVSKSFFLSDDIVFISGVGANSGSTILRLYAEDYGSATSGNYSLYKQISLTDTIYPTPYVDGTHVQDNLSYNLDWGSEGTLEFWIDIQHEYNPPADLIYFGNRIYDSTLNNVIQLYYDTSNANFVISLRNSSGTGYNFTTDAYTSGTWLSRGFHHFKIIYSTTNNANVQLRIDGGDDDISTRPTLSGTFDFLPYITIGSRIPTTGPTALINTLIDDILWQPTVDTSSTHYTGGNPYVKGNKTYGANGNFSVDEQGNVVASSFRDNEDLNFFDPLPEGDVLFLDGTRDLATSRGDLPIEEYSSIKYVESKLIIDGAEYNNFFTKFPGKTASYGMFDDYPNQINNNPFSSWAAESGASIVQDYEWLTIDNGAATTGRGVTNQTILTGTGLGFVGLTIHNVNNAVTTVLDLSNYTSSTVDINWGSQTITDGPGWIDLNSHFISENIVQIAYRFDTNSGTNIRLRIFPDTGNANKIIRVTEVQLVNFGGVEPWFYPYFREESPATQLAYRHDWGQQGTVECWAYVNFDYNVGADRTLFDNRTFISTNGTGSIGLFYINSSDRFDIVIRNTSGTTHEFLTSTYTSGTWIGRGWHYFKVTYDTTDNTNFHLYIDGNNDLITTRPSLTGSFDLNKYITIGTYSFSNTPGNNWMGLITDFRWSPSIDTSNTHYASNNPYYVPSTNYNSDRTYSVDKQGRISARSITTIDGIPGKFEAIWDGNDAAPRVNLSTGFYLFQISENQAATPTVLISSFMRFDRSANVLHRGTCYTTNDGTIIPQITADGIPTLDRTGSQYPNRRYRKIWRLIQ